MSSYAEATNIVAEQAALVEVKSEFFYDFSSIEAFFKSVDIQVEKEGFTLKEDSVEPDGDAIGAENALLYKLQLCRVFFV